MLGGVAESELSETGPASAAGGARGESEREELGKLPAAVARRVAEAKATIPHGYATRRVEIPDGAEMPVALIAAIGVALAQHPGLNAGYRDGGIVRYSRANVGFLIETPQGALVPTLFDADRMTMDQISDRVEELRRDAAAGSLAAPALAGGTFTVSAIEAGADAVAGVVSPGQVGHLASGRPREAAISDGGRLRAGPVVDLTLSFDQRAVRPEAAAAFLGTLAELFEHR